MFWLTLRRQWPSLGLIRPVKEKKLPVVLSQAEVRSLLGGVQLRVYRVCLSTIYACGLRISEGAALQVTDVDCSNEWCCASPAKAIKNGKCRCPTTLESLRAFWKCIAPALGFPGRFAAPLPR